MCTQIKQYIVYHLSCPAVNYPPLIRLIAAGANDFLHLAVVIFCCKSCHFCRARDGEDDRGHWGAELTTGRWHLIHPNELPCCPHRAFVIYLEPDTHNLQKCRRGSKVRTLQNWWEHLEDMSVCSEKTFWARTFSVITSWNFLICVYWLLISTLILL